MDFIEHSPYYRTILQFLGRAVRDFLDAFRGVFRNCPFLLMETSARFSIGAIKTCLWRWCRVYVEEIAKRWVADGNSVTLFCGNDGHQPRHETRHGIRIVRRGGFYLVYLWAVIYYFCAVSREI